MRGLERAVGAMLGLAVGDAVGTTLEFRSPGSFEPLDDMVGGGPFNLKAGEWTDDTSMALCLAESILDTGGMHLEDQLRRYLLWHDDGYLSSNGCCFDIGRATSAQLRRFERTGDAVDPNPDENAAANGSLMRLSPVAVRWHQDLTSCVDRAAESSRSTHPARRPVDSCRLLGAMLGALIRGETFEAVTADSFWSWGTLHPEVAAIAAGNWKRKPPPDIRGTGYCVNALEAALWSVGGADDFRTAVLRAANLGDDADTTAAIAGQIAGACFGASGIPSSWTEKVARADRITSLARNLFFAEDLAQDTEPWPYEHVVHAWWVEPGRLLAGEFPGHPDRNRAMEKLEVLVDAGIRTFVDLTTTHDGLEPYVPLLQAIADNRNLDLRRDEFAIPDLGVFEDREYDRAIRMIEAAKGRGGVFLHCWGGVGRTGTVVGCYLVDRGLSYGEVQRRFAMMRHGTGKEERPIRETEYQRGIIKRRAARYGKA
jgi:ADP-ribosyl-[dinitrogen reductase] hydrolase